MIDKAIAPVEVRNQRLFGPKAAARYLGICEDTLKKITDLGQLRAFNMNGVHIGLKTWTHMLSRYPDGMIRQARNLQRSWETGESHDL